MTQNVSETLNRAADLIERHGWRKGGGWPLAAAEDVTSLCLEGGIMAALGMHVTDDDFEFVTLWGCPAYCAVADYLDRDITYNAEHNKVAEPLYRWNDRQAKTAEEVIETLRAAAVTAAAREVDVQTVTAEPMAVTA